LINNLIFVVDTLNQQKLMQLFEPAEEIAQRHHDEAKSRQSRW